MHHFTLFLMQQYLHTEYIPVTRLELKGYLGFSLNMHSRVEVQVNLMVLSYIILPEV